MEEIKIKKLEKILDVINDGTTSSDDIVRVITSVLDIIKQLKGDLESQISEQVDELSSTIETNSYSLRDSEIKLEKLINDAKQSSVLSIKTLKSQLTEEIDKISLLIPESADLSFIESRLTKLENEEKTDVISEINASDKKIRGERVEGFELLKRIPDIERMSQANADVNALPPTTTHFYSSGLFKGRAKNINITGGTVTVSGDTATIATGSGSGSGHTIQDEGVSLTQRTKLNFVGSGVVATDDAGNDATVITISGAAVSFIDNELLGTGDGTTTVFTLANTPVAGSVHIYAGVRQTLTTDYSISGTTVTFVNPPPDKQAVIADYKK